ncbi:cytochrome c3 family protein [Sansalvadorimonas sp. 2012CJ34-2]|uniref:Cytochrome c-type protein n=1 Tax=Parendozoicomonas callyspongiae TaxID=2942213 RepID=A0ABT0PC46_9GAMM|nr:cytochrome c3 family protein [Sansalvadorimonas sp. 2012CJ34-2]MCL6268919.1 cytochrome c3 family protein [Sansalvadorimonas sp. 2012CJ34-2]
MAKELFIKRYWKMLKRPTSVALGLILLFGFAAGIIFWGGFNTSMEMSNKEEFCIGCHEMKDNVYEEYKSTIHYSNRSGVRAICSDCHVPKEWGPKMVRKIQASKELWGKIAGTIDTREKFLDHRLEMAEREWARMKANDSQECRNCHNFEFMDYSEQSNRAFTLHEKAQKNGQTCIDCHKGIAHELPDMSHVDGWGG